MTEYTIAELARLAGTNVRNVRAYQQRGLIPRPRRRGRAGIYSEAHLVRLRLVGRLLDRGYSLANIGEMMHAFERGRDVAELLGLERAIASPWTSEAPALLEPGEVLSLFGKEVSRGEIEEAIRLGIVRPEGDRLRVPSPRLLEVGAELVRAGLPLRKVLAHLGELREDMERVARRFVKLVDEELFLVFGKDRLPPKKELPRLADAVERLRPLALRVVELELARALEDEVGRIMGDRIARIARALPTTPGRPRGRRRSPRS